MRAPGTVSCTLGALDAAAQAVVTVTASAANAGTLAATAAISAALSDPEAANDTAVVTVTSRPVTDARVQVTGAADAAVPGQSLQYTTTVANPGPDDLPATTVTISVLGASVSSAIADRGSCAVTGATATCTVPSVTSGGSATIQVQASAGSAGTASVTANVTFDGTDTSAANNSATQTTTINAPPSGGGGGGAAGLLELFALLATLLTASVSRPVAARARR